MEVTIPDIERYLGEVKAAIRAGRCRFEMNSKRQENNALFFDYLIDEEKRRQILLSLTPQDFSEVLHNEHKNYGHELLYVFGKDVKLLQRFGSRCETVSLYIKFNKLENQSVVIISFHRQKFPIRYKFK